MLNDAGQTAFSAQLTGSGVDETNNQGIWATNPTGALQLIARTGDPLEVAPGDFRTINGLSFIADTGNSDGRPSGFNNLGQLAFRAVFTDESQGVFVSSLVAIPEPSSFALAAVCVLGLIVRPARQSPRLFYCIADARKKVTMFRFVRPPTSASGLIRKSLLTMVVAFSVCTAATSAARADIFQWEYINPADPSQGRKQSTTLAPDGAGVSAVPGANLSNRNLHDGVSELHEFDQHEL